MGCPPDSVLRSQPLPDFGGLHPDPNLAYPRTWYDDHSQDRPLLDRICRVIASRPPSPVSPVHVLPFLYLTSRLLPSGLAGSSGAPHGPACGRQPGRFC